jgi:hypothetical protein
MSKWRKLRGLSWAERLLLAQAAVALPAVAALIRVRGLKGCQALLARLSPLANPGLRADGPAESLARGVVRIVTAAAAHGPYRANCLQQSVTLWWLLRRRGLEGELRIGTRKMDGHVDAHAWVEFSGRALNESRDVGARYAVFERPVNSPGARSG